MLSLEDTKFNPKIDTSIDVGNKSGAAEIDDDGVECKATGSDDGKKRQKFLKEVNITDLWGECQNFLKTLDRV